MSIITALMVWILHDKPYVALLFIRVVDDKMISKYCFFRVGKSTLRYLVAKHAE